MSFKYRKHDSFDAAEDPTRCDVSVSARDRWARSHQCPNPFVTEYVEDGEKRRYCMTHDPEQKAKRDARRPPTRFERDCAARHRRRDTENEMRTALESIRDGHSDAVPANMAAAALQRVETINKETDEQTLARHKGD